MSRRANLLVFLAQAAIMGSCATGRPEKPWGEWGPATPSVRSQSAHLQQPAQQLGRSDARIRDDLLLALASDPDLDPFDYRVQVKHGSARVQTEKLEPAERVLLESRLKSFASPLEVSESPRAPAPPPEPPATDSSIRRKVIDELRADDWLSSSQIHVGVADKHVTLKGSVSHLEEKRRAEEGARKVAGVSDITNTIQVQPTGRSDLALTRDVRAALRTAVELDPYFDPAELSVSVRSGVVELGGRVDDASEKRFAIETVSKVRGVLAIRDRLAPQK